MPRVEPSPSPAAGNASDGGDGNVTDVDSTDTPPPSAPPAADEGDAAENELGPTGGMNAPLQFPEIFAYVWVGGGSLCVCCSVFLFIHRANALNAVPCLRCCTKF